jgi:predicted acetyltransferase
VLKNLSLRPVTAGELESFARAEARANNRHATQEYVVHGQHSLATDRTLAAFDGDELVATSVSHAFQISIPGGELPLGGIGWVSVLPTHRRRGIMTQLVDEHLRASHERGECLCGLWSTGGDMYARYGFGISAFSESWKIDAHNARLNTVVPNAGRLISLHTPESRVRFPDVFTRLGKQRTGVVERDEIFWDVEFEDREEQRHGASGFFFTGYELDNQLDGYLKYRINEERRELEVSELVSTTLDASTTLWAYCFELEQIDTISAWNRPVDDPLPWQVTNPRVIKRNLHDAMWLRLVSVSDALTSRAYATKNRLVLQVADTICPWNDGRYELNVDAAAVSCEQTTAPADVTVDVSVLGAIYLGGISPGTLHRAGGLEQHRDGAVTELANLFATSVSPWTPHVF